MRAWHQGQHGPWIGISDGSTGWGPNTVMLLDQAMMTRAYSNRLRVRVHLSTQANEVRRDPHHAARIGSPFWSAGVGTVLVGKEYGTGAEWDRHRFRPKHPGLPPDLGIASHNCSEPKLGRHFLCYECIFSSCARSFLWSRTGANSQVRQEQRNGVG